MPTTIGTLLAIGAVAIGISPVVDESSTHEASNQLRQVTAHINSQIDLYRFQHNGALPAAGSEDEEVFRRNLLCTSWMSGHTDGHLEPLEEGSGPYGPYFTSDIPTNPLNGRNDVLVTTDTTPVQDGTTGWWYSSTTGKCLANLAPAEHQVATDTPITAFRDLY